MPNRRRIRDVQALHGNQLQSKRSQKFVTSQSMTSRLLARRYGGLIFSAVHFQHLMILVLVMYQRCLIPPRASTPCYPRFCMLFMLPVGPLHEAYFDFSQITAFFNFYVIKTSVRSLSSNFSAIGSLVS